MLVADYKKKYDQKQAIFIKKILICGKCGPLVVNQDIKTFGKVFDFLKPISKVNFWLPRHIAIPILSFSLHLNSLSITAPRLWNDMPPNFHSFRLPSS